MKTVDVCIIGAGLVGLTLAASLKDSGLSVVILDANDPTHTPKLPDTRTLALNYNTIQFLEALKIWPDVKSQACPIEQVHVSEKGTSAIAKLTATEAELDALGYVTPIIHLYPHILKTAQSSAEILAPVKVTKVNTQTGEITCEGKTELKAKIIIAADGAKSFIREKLGFDIHHKDYEQTALVTSVTLKNAHQNIAYERFLPEGVLALLPLTQNRYGIVWSASTQESEQRFQLEDEALLEDIQTAFGYRVGKMTQLGARNTYPLHQIVAKESQKGCLMLLGNSAHNLNPVAAQGFNLCVQDIQALSKLIQTQGASPEIFQEYQRSVAPIHQKIIQTTDLIATTFASNNPLTKMGRRAAITGINRCQIAKKQFTDMMTGQV